jgi:UrcA family protein
MSVTISDSSRARRITVTLLAACAVTALSAAANLAKAADAPATASVVVRYADLDVATPNGAAKLYRRIASAAHQVCPQADSSRLEDKMAAWSCRRQAVNRAVEQVNSPQVASLMKHTRLAAAR